MTTPPLQVISLSQSPKHKSKAKKLPISRCTQPQDKNILLFSSSRLVLIRALDGPIPGDINIRHGLVTFQYEPLLIG